MRVHALLAFGLFVAAGACASFSSSPQVGPDAGAADADITGDRDGDGDAKSDGAVDAGDESIAFSDDFEHTDILGPWTSVSDTNPPPGTIAIVPDDAGGHYLRTHAGALQGIALEKILDRPANEVQIDLDLGFESLAALVITFAVDFDSEDAGDTATSFLQFNGTSKPSLVLQHAADTTDDNLEFSTAGTPALARAHVSLTVRVDTSGNAVASLAPIEGLSIVPISLPSANTKGRFRQHVRGVRVGENYVYDGGGTATFLFDNVVVRVR